MNPSTYSSEPGNLAWHTPTLLRVAAQLVVWVWRWNSDHEGQRPWLGRFTSHIAVALTLTFFVLIAGMRLDALVSASESADKALLGGTVRAMNVTASVVARPYYRGTAQTLVVRRAQSHTAIPERPRLEIVTYVVMAGDTAETIAEGFGLQPTTLLWANAEMEKAPDLLKVGQVLTILPLDGVYHTVEISDTLDSLAEKYKVTAADIANCLFNALPEDGQLVVGEKIIVPGGMKPYTAQKVTTYEGPIVEDVSGSGLFYWPTSGDLTQGYWWAHRAIDIGGSVGRSVIASDAGYVSFAGWTDVGYGYLVVVDHANGYQTYYAHLSNFFVSEGETVVAGQVIGAMGSTGNSTGPHLHYEIRYNGYPTNPLIYLP
ncbi:MAG TPA: peptidoglycan DD-metalloendopeptidase family protein [Anaerolineae bacterium]|nr:peptidoglycan DD-metalloendopeptidase family protein [Anaerolineae bacterium]